MKKKCTDAIFVFSFKQSDNLTIFRFESWSNNSIIVKLTLRWNLLFDIFTYQLRRHRCFGIKVWDCFWFSLWKRRPFAFNATPLFNILTKTMKKIQLTITANFKNKINCFWVLLVNKFCNFSLCILKYSENIRNYKYPSRVKS